jgi:hypothetical protein
MTADQKAKQVIEAIARHFGSLAQVERFDAEWYHLCLNMASGRLLQVQTGGEGSTDIYWEEMGPPHGKGEASFAEATGPDFLELLAGRLLGAPAFPAELLNCDGECGFIPAGAGYQCKEGDGCGMYVHPGDVGFAELDAYHKHMLAVERP